MRQFTIELAKKFVKNRFELVILTSQRARDLSLGANPEVNVKAAKSQKSFYSGASKGEVYDKDSHADKSVTIALKEISENLVEFKRLKSLVIKRHKFSTIDFGYSPEVDILDNPSAQDSGISNIDRDNFFNDKGSVEIQG